MMSQESFNCLRHGVVPVEIALVGEAGHRSARQLRSDSGHHIYGASQRRNRRSRCAATLCGTVTLTFWEVSVLFAIPRNLTPPRARQSDAA